MTFQAQQQAIRWQATFYPGQKDIPCRNTFFFSRKLFLKASYLQNLDSSWIGGFKRYDVVKGQSGHPMASHILPSLEDTIYRIQSLFLLRKQIFFFQKALWRLSVQTIGFVALNVITLFRLTVGNPMASHIVRSQKALFGGYKMQTALGLVALNVMTLFRLRVGNPMVRHFTQPRTTLTWLQLQSFANSLWIRFFWLKTLDLYKGQTQQFCLDPDWIGNSGGKLNFLG